MENELCSNPYFASPTSQDFHLHHLASSPCPVVNFGEVRRAQLAKSTLLTSTSVPLETFQSLHLCHNSFSNPPVVSPTSQVNLQPFFSFSYVTRSSQSSFSNHSVTSPTSQLILQPFRCFAYVTVHSPTLLSRLLRHKLFA